MRFRVTRIDIEKTRSGWPGGTFMPALVLPREDRDTHTWHVIDKPVKLTAPHQLSWAVAAGDEYIRIPLFYYEMPPCGDAALAFVFRLGLVCGNLTGRPISFAHVVIGNPAELVYNADGSPADLACWLGVAFTFED